MRALSRGDGSAGTGAVSPTRWQRRTAGARVTQLVLPGITLLTDTVVVLTSILAAAELRTSIDILADATDVQPLIARIGLFILLGWLVVLASFGTYSTHGMSAGTAEYKNVINASVVTAGGIGVVCYLAKIPLSRAYFVLVFLIGVPALVLARLILRRLLHGWRRRGLFGQRVLVAGDPVNVDELTAVMERERWLGYHVIGALAPTDDDSDLGETPLAPVFHGEGRDGVGAG